jgi:hypothetical protein
VAAASDTIGYDILTGLGRRFARIHVKAAENTARARATQAG